MTTNQSTNALLMTATLLFGVFGALFLSTFTKPGDSDEAFRGSKSSVSTKLADLPNGIFSLMEENDSELANIFSINLAFQDGTNGEQHLEVGGFERHAVAANDEDEDEALTLESLVFYLDNSKYHSLQLLHGYDEISGEETHHMTLHDDNSTHMMLKPGRHLGQQRRHLGSCDDCVKKLKLNKCKSCRNSLKDKAKEVDNLKSEVYKYKNAYNKYREYYNKAKDTANDLKRKVADMEDKVRDLKGEVKDLESVKKSLNNKVKQLEKKTKSIANNLPKKVVNPIKRKIVAAKEDLQALDNLAGSVAESTVNKIKELNFLPETGLELAGYLESAFLDFMSQEFCLPYSCVAKKLGLDVNDNLNSINIELYKTPKVSIDTVITPKTCLQVTEIRFDVSKLDDFLNLFNNLEALDDIFDQVTIFLVEQMNQIVGYANDVVGLLDNIEDIVNDAADELGLGRRMLVSTETQEPVSLEEVSAMAYQKGLERFHELYGQHITRVFNERRLSENGGTYIGLSALVLELTADFGQTINLAATDRTGYAGSVFDESVQKTSVMPIPFTGGMMKLVGSGSMKASMPYAMVMEGAANAEFGYNVGEMAVSVDVVTGAVTNNKDSFSTNFNVNATAGVSGSMSLNFDASASMGLCLGHDNDACITITIDASQMSAAGFDALAGLNLGEDTLSTMYTDVLEYESDESCDDQLSISAGYWQYVKEPSVKVSITGTDCCTENNDVLYERKGEVAQNEIDNFCLSADAV